MHFDGVNDYAYNTGPGGYFGLNDTGMGPWTASMWFKTPYAGGYQYLWSLYNYNHTEWSRLALGQGSDPYAIFFQTSHYAMEWDGVSGYGGGGQYGYIVQPSASGSVNELCDGAWHHVAVTVEGVASTGKIYLYVDGALAASGNQMSGVVKPDRKQRISGYNYDNTQNLNGRVAQFALMQSELSASEISTLYNSGAGMDPTTLHTVYSYFRFGDDPGDTASLIKNGGTYYKDLAVYNGPTIVTDSPP